MSLNMFNECKACEGTGIVKTRPCKKCSGEGMVIVEEITPDNFETWDDEDLEDFDPIYSDNF